jgi:orotidine-5'-phosphate decarboxylase
MSFDILSEKIAAKDNPTVLGLDPRLDHIPPYMLQCALDERGETPEAAAAAVLTFNKGLIDTLHKIVPAVKLQSACYEAFGPAGMNVMRQTMMYAAEHDLYVIADAKRGDIGSTAEAYAEAFLGETVIGEKAYRPFPADCLTVNAYLGSDGVLPFIRQCEQYDRAIFILAKTSNPSSGEFQDRDVEGMPLYRQVANMANAWRKTSMPVGMPSYLKGGWGHAGLVVGATYPAQLAEMRAAFPDIFFLIPGYGAQGGSAADLAHGFNADGNGAIVNSSRAITCAWKKNGIPYRNAARKEALRMREELRAVLKG